MFVWNEKKSTERKFAAAWKNFSAGNLLHWIIPYATSKNNVVVMMVRVYCTSFSSFEMRVLCAYVLHNSATAASIWLLYWELLYFDLVLSALPNTIFVAQTMCLEYENHVNTPYNDSSVWPNYYLLGTMAEQQRAFDCGSYSTWIFCVFYVRCTPYTHWYVNIYSDYNYLCIKMPNILLRQRFTHPRSYQWFENHTHSEWETNGSYFMQIK